MRTGIEKDEKEVDPDAQIAFSVAPNKDAHLAALLGIKSTNYWCSLAASLAKIRQQRGKATLEHARLHKLAQLISYMVLVVDWFASPRCFLPLCTAVDNSQRLDPCQPPTLHCKRWLSNLLQNSASVALPNCGPTCAGLSLGIMERSTHEFSPLALQAFTANYC